MPVSSLTPVIGAINAILPVWLIVTITVGMLGLLAYGCHVLVRKRVPARWVGILAALRVIIIIVFVLCLLRPVFSYTRSVMREPGLLVMLDVSRSMSDNQSSQGGQNNPNARFEAIKEQLRGDLADRLNEHYDVRWFAFDSEARPVSADQFADLSPQGQDTRIGASLESAWHFYREAGTSDAAANSRVLLVSDGHDHGDQDAVAIAEQLGLSVDVMPPAGAARGTGSPDVTVAGVQTVPRVLIQSELRFGITLQRGRATGAQTVTLRLAENGEAQAQDEVRFNANQLERYVELRYRPTEPGLKQYSFNVLEGGLEQNPAPVANNNNNNDAQQNNANNGDNTNNNGDANNNADGNADNANDTDAPLSSTDPDAFSVTVQVTSDRYEVLFLEDKWRWSFRYLRRIFEDDPSFNFTAFLPRGPNQYVPIGEPGREAELSGFPQGFEELSWFDVIVLGDVDPQRWSDEIAPAIRELVVERGRSLVVIAGPGTSRLAREPALRELLPVELPAQMQPFGGPVQMRLTRAGQTSPIFTQPTTPAIWRNLPAVDQIYPPVRKKPGATILAELVGYGNDYGNFIVLARHTVGRGQVFYVGTDTLWRWHTMGPETQNGLTPYEVFWQQVLRALAPTRPSPGVADLRLRPDRSRYQAGDAVQLTAALRSNRALEEPNVSANVQRPDGSDVPLVLLPDPVDPQTYTAEFDTGAPGTYTITASADQADRALASARTAINVAPAGGEANDRGINRTMLQRLARSTDGRLIDPNDQSTWPQAAETRADQEQRTFDLWNNFTLMLILCALLAFDWLLRLVRGYV